MVRILTTKIREKITGILKLKDKYHGPFKVLGIETVRCQAPSLIILSVTYIRDHCQFFAGNINKGLVRKYYYFGGKCMWWTTSSTVKKSSNFSISI